MAWQTKRGEVRNPQGRIAGGRNGRARALGVLDKLLGKEENRIKLMIALQRKFDEDPFWFFKNIVIPLLPKEPGGGDMRLRPTRFSTDEIIYAMDSATVSATSGYRMRLPPELQTGGMN